MVSFPKLKTNYVNVHSKTWLIRNCNSKFDGILNFSLNLHPKEEKVIQIYLVILKILIIRNFKEKSVL
jgi:hypothetical protein